ncbi:MAG: hypothetical protein AB8G05_15345 [Oligoflexales bacterium]
METNTNPIAVSNIKIFENGLKKLVDDFFSDANQSKEKLHTMVNQIKQLNTDNMYKDCFPKICKNCRETYKCKNDYSEKTVPLLHENDEIGMYDQKCGFIEYANCNCGTTLVLVLRKIRNDSKFGSEKRRIFNNWLERLGDQFPQVRKKDLSEILRFLYRHV